MIIKCSSVLIICFVTNKSETHFNDGRKASATLSHISRFLYLPRQYFNVKRFLEIALSHTFWVFYQSGTESSTKEPVPTALTHIFKFDIDQE